MSQDHQPGDAFMSIFGYRRAEPGLAEDRLCEDARLDLDQDDDDDFELPPACPLRNNGDEICESCQ